MRLLVLASSHSRVVTASGGLLRKLLISISISDHSYLEGLVLAGDRPRILVDPSVYADVVFARGRV